MEDAAVVSTQEEVRVRLFIDTGSVEEVEEVSAWGVLSGATTNPTLLAAEQGDPGQILRRICELVRGPVSAEVVADDPREMVRQGRALARLHEHVVVKVPFGAAGLAATRALSDDGIAVNMTLVFSPTQALLSAEAGARFISCFMGRLDDVSIDSAEVLAGIIGALRPAGVRQGWAPDAGQVLAASIRHPEHVVTAARLGCEVATIPGKVLRQMLVHPLTAAGVERFDADWRSRPEFGRWLDGLLAAEKIPAAAVGAPL
jgi:transaldolase